jgi:uncharacterized protein (TIGR02246 family)
MIFYPKGRQISKCVFCSCFVLLLFASACSQEPADTRSADEATIRNLDAQWSKAAEARNLDAAVSYYSDDATMFPPNAPMTSGKAAIRALWESMLAPGMSLTWQATKVEVARSSDLAYIMGTYHMMMKGPKGEPIMDMGKFVEVWKKQADGNWKTVADIFNSDTPLPAPPPPPKKK